MAGIASEAETGSVWGDFPVSCVIRRNGRSEPFEGRLEWVAQPIPPDPGRRSVLLHFADGRDAEVGDTSPGGRIEFGLEVVEGLASGDGGAKASVMDAIQKAWADLDSWSLPDAGEG